MFVQDMPKDNRQSRFLGFAFKAFMKQGTDF